MRNNEVNLDYGPDLIQRAMAPLARNCLSKLLLSFAVLLFGLTVAQANSTTPKPSIDLQPEQVVEIVIEALRANDPANNDDGIAIVFDFASPNNKLLTGPIERFTRMIKGGFSSMLNHSRSEFSKMRIEDGIAMQAVWLFNEDGSKAGYVFEIHKQVGGQYDGMWMTESVWPIGASKPLGQAI